MRYRPAGSLVLLCHKTLCIPLHHIYGWELSFMKVEDGSLPEHRWRRGAFLSLRRGPGQGVGTRRPRDPVPLVLHGPAVARGSQERRTHGGARGTRAGPGGAPVVAPLRGQGGLVGRGGAGRRPRPGAAGHRTTRTDPRLDDRRHRRAQKGHAFGGRGTAVPRSVGQTGQLPGRGYSVGRQRSRQSAAGAPALSPEVLGRRSGTARPRGRAR